MRLTKDLLVACAVGLLAACQGSTTLSPDLERPDAAVTASLGTWSTKARMPFPRSFFGAAANDGILYAVGGSFSDETGVHASRNLQAYDLRTNTWSARAPIPVPWAWGNGATFVNGKLYICGGYSKALYVYDPATNRWTRKADMPQVTGYGSQGVIAGQLYVYFGGSTSNEGAFFRYNPATNTWKRLPTAPPGRGEMAAAGVIGGRFYVAGGQSDYSPVPYTFVYDPATNAWRARAPMPMALTGLASAVIAKKLYVAGGGGCDTCPGTQTLQVYDPATDTWEVKTPMPTARLHAAGAVAQGKFYVLGGSTSIRSDVGKVEVYTP
jgi:N-acetylneuraminic acid mutarotase